MQSLKVLPAGLLSQYRLATRARRDPLNWRIGYLMPSLLLNLIAAAEGFGSAARLLESHDRLSRAADNAPRGAGFYLNQPGSVEERG